MKRLFTLIVLQIFSGFYVLPQNQKIRSVNHSQQSRAPFELRSFGFEDPIPQGMARIILAAGDIWGDGSGYQMLLDEDAIAYGTIIPVSGPLTNSGDAPQSIYDQFEYKIPENADGTLTTQNIVFNNAIAIDIPVGVYDYCITNPLPGDRMWIAWGDYSRGNDVVFEENKIYQYTVFRTTDADGIEMEVIDPSCLISIDIPYFEDFEQETFSSCWRQEYIQGNNRWQVIDAYSGTPGTVPNESNFKANFYHASHNVMVTKLILPMFDLSALSSPGLSFWHTQRNWAGDQDELRVYYKNATDGAWILLAEYTEDIYDWQEEIIALPNPTATYWIAFEGSTHYGHGIQLDDIFIGSTCPKVQNLAVAQENNNVLLSWDAIENSDFLSYTIYKDEQLLATNITTTSYTDENVEKGDHQYCIAAVYDECGESVLVCRNILVTESGDCDAPENLNIQTHFGFPYQVYLSWIIPESNEGNYPMGVNIYRNGLKLNNTPLYSNSYYDHVPEAGNYTYNITMVWDNYCESAVIGQTVVIECADYCYFDLFCPQTALNEITITWNIYDTPEAISAYQIYRNGAHIATVFGTNYTDSGLPKGWYEYGIAVVYENGCVSQKQYINVLAIEQGDCPKPQDINSTLHYDEWNGVYLYWNWPEQNGAAFVMGFNVYRDGIRLNDQIIEWTSYFDIAPGPGTYQYGISAVWNDGCESEQEELSITIDAPLAIKLYGYRVFDNGSTRRELVSFMSNNPSNITIESNYQNGSSIRCGEYFDGNIYAYSLDANNNPLNFIKLSENWEEISSTSVTAFAQEMAYDYSSYTMYGIRLHSSYSELCTVNLETGTLTSVADMSLRFIVFACSLEGQLYGIAFDGNLYAINKTNGTTTLIGATGFIPSYAQSMAFDHNSGKLFWAHMDQDSNGKLIEIDPATGVGTNYGTLGNNAEVVMLYTPYSNNEAPAAPIAFTATPAADGSLSCLLSWTNPELNYEGNALTELTSVVIKRNNEIIHTIENPVMGATESWTDTPSTYNDYVYTIYGVNSFGDGVRVTQTVSFVPPPATIPYTHDFEDTTENAKWSLLNGTQTNKWYIGDVVSNGGSQSLYISNTGTTHTYDITATSYVYAYRTLNFVEAGGYYFRFDWMAYGEGNWDNLRAFLVPATIPLSAGNAYGMSGASNSVPDNWIALSLTLGGRSAWQSFNTGVTVPDAGLYSLVFFWKNDPSLGTQPPATVDNIHIEFFGSPLAGIYTIDNTQPTAGRNFNTFEDAIEALNTRGISDAVTFEVISGQVHNIALTDSRGLRIVSGGTADKPVIFRKSGTEANPLLKVTGASNASNDLCLFLDGVNHITFDGIDVENAGTIASWSDNDHLEYAFYLSNTNNISIINCNIKLSQSSYYTSYGIYTTGSINYLHTENVNIKNAYYGYYFQGSDTGNTIDKNTIDSTTWGICVYYYSGTQNNLTIKNNKITNAGTGIQLGYGNNQRVYNNVIHATSIGMDLYYSNSTDTLHLAHNTVYIPATAYTAYCLQKYYSDGKVGLYNNIFINKSTSSSSYCFYNNSDNSNILSESNNNIYYCEQGAIYYNPYNNITKYTVKEYMDLLADGRENNSHQVEVPFISIASPFNFNISTDIPTKAESSGQPLSWVLTDIESNARNNETPDIGAYEFDGIYDDADLSPLAGIYTIDNTQPTAGRNFNTFEDAIEALNTRGISDAVTFEVISGQVHNIALTDSRGLRIVSGGTADKPVIFRKSGTEANPLLKVTGASNASNDLCLFLDGVNHITFDGIDVENAGTIASWSDNDHLEYAFYLSNTNNISIINCNIKLSQSSYYTSYGIYTTGSINYLHTENVNIKNAYYGYYFQGSDTGNTIDKNTIDSTTWGICVYYSGTQNNLTIKNNKITNAGTGIQLGYGNNQRVYNNVIHATATGIYLGHSTTTDTVYLAHNTVYIPATAYTAYCLQKYYFDGKVGLYNNIFINKSTSSRSYCFYNSSDNAILPESNNNIYYCEQGAIYYNPYNNITKYTVKEYMDLLADGRENNSHQGEVPFISIASPFNFNISTDIPTKAESSGQPLSWVLTDIESNARNNETPDIGAYEFEGIYDDADLSPLAGIYTIDNTQPTAGRNFNTFEDAIEALNTRGISDAVTFEVISGQVHNIALTDSRGLRIVSGGTADKPVIFRKSGTEANPLLKVTGASNASNDLCLFLDGVNHITFDGIDVENAGTIASWSDNDHLEYAFYLSNTNNISIINCNIKLSQSSYYTSYGIYTTGSINYLHTENVNIKNAYYGYYFQGSDTGNTIDKNTIDSTTWGICVYYYSGTQNNLTIKNNKITNAGTGIQLGYGNNQRVYNNVIHATSIGMDLYYSNSTDTLHLAHNTVYIPATAYTAYCLQKYYSDGKVGLYNNIFINKSTSSSSYCFYNNSDNSNILSESNNNIYYKTNGYIYRNSAATANTLDAYRTLLADNRESNSVEEDVLFISTVAPFNFDICSDIPTAAESGGQIITAFPVTTDLEGNLRHGAEGYAGTGTAPDIGAYEFEGISRHFQLVCSGDSTKTVDFSTLHAATSFAWQIKQQPTYITGYLTSGNGFLPKMKLSNDSDKTDTLIYTVTPDAGSSFEYKIIVYPFGTLEAIADNIFPVDSSVIENTSITFTWPQVAGALFYDIYIWNADEACPAQPTRANLQSTQYYNYNFAYGNSYQWKIVAKNYCATAESEIFTFDIRKLPNLHVSNVSVGEIDKETRNVTVTYTVRDDGEGDVIETTHKDRIWIVSSLEQGTLSPIVHLLAEVDNIKPLASGESYSNTVNITIPGRFFGTYYIIVTTDMERIYSIDWAPAGNIIPIPYQPDLSGTPYPYLYATGYNEKIVSEVGENAYRSDNFFYIQVEVPQPPIDQFITTSHESINFGNVPIETHISSALVITAQDLEEALTVTLTGDDAETFIISYSNNWDEETGGNLTVIFAPEELKDYQAALNIASGAIQKTIPLTGAGTYPTEINITAHVENEIYTSYDEISITGEAKYINDMIAANVPIEVCIEVIGYRRALRTTTDENGLYEVLFTPQPGEAGHYNISAYKRGSIDYTAKAVFDIPGMKLASDNFILWEVEKDIAKSGTITIMNRSAISLNNIRIETLSGLPNADFNFSTASVLNGLDVVELNYTVTGTALTTTANWEEIKLQAISDEGITHNFSVWFYCKKARGVLEAYPDAINCYMTKGKTKLVEFDVLNNGNGPTGVINISVPKVDWMELVCLDTLASLNPHDSARISIRLKPQESTPLNVSFTGAIAVNCENGNSVSVPFNIKAISDSTGHLVVDVVDEYFYNTAEQTHVANAHVVLTHPYSHEVVAEGYTGTDGLFRANDLPEGYYAMTIEAPKHESYRNNILIEAGQTNHQQIFISFRAITYSWSVVPTEIEDEYEIELITKFETNVPAPVVTIDVPKEMPELDYGEDYLFDIVLTNHGLIAALNVHLTVPSIKGYSFTPLFEYVDTLAAKSQITIPVQFKRDLEEQSKSKSMLTTFNVRGEADPEDPCWVQFGEWHEYKCGKDKKYYEGRSYVIKIHRCALAAILAHINIPNLPCLFCGGGGGNGGGSGWVNDDPPPPIINEIECVECDPLDIVGSCGCAVLSYLFKGGAIDKICKGIGVANCGINLLRNQNITDIIACASNIPVIGGAFGCGFAIGNYINCLMGVEPFMKSFSSPNSTTSFINDIDSIIKFFDYRNNIIIEYFGNDNLFTRNDYESFFNFISPFLIDELAIDIATKNSILNSLHNSDIQAYEIEYVIDRWNTTIIAWSNGIYSPNLTYTDIVDKVKIEVIFQSIIGLHDYAEERGFEDLYDMYEHAKNEIQILEERNNSNSVCASVTLQIDQKLTMTREAFRGTLTLYNGNETTAMENVSLDLVIKDENGTLSNHLFHIETEKLLTLTGIDGSGSLDAESEGTATILFIPTVNAAPTTMKRYSFGGTLSYLDPFTGTQVTVDLFPVTLEVHPSPYLHLYYFMQRDILGDDPLTEAIEPSIPADLGVMIDNKGYGTAKNLVIESAQPKIIDNEKGLDINFELIGASLNGAERQLGLNDINFGNLAGKKQAVGIWSLTSSLLGHFTSYESRIKHLDSRGNPDLSLVEDVEIHELTRTITAYGNLDDGIPDFLVNDIPDADDYPDAIYFSNATRTNVVLAEDAYVDHLVTDLNPVANLAVKSSAIGWNFARIDDPAQGKYRLISATREDGQEIPLTNIWQTYCTLPDGGEPIYENKLHFVDTCSLKGWINYTLVFGTLDPLTITAAAGTGGDINPSGEILLSHGDNQTFTFVANPGYEVDQLLIDGSNVADSIAGGSYTFENVTEDHTIEVTFKPIPPATYTITATAGENGSIDPEGEITVTEGDNQTFTFTADNGYEVDQLLIDEVNVPDSIAGGSYTFENVTEGHSIEVTFKPIPPATYIITATAGANGTISPNGNILVNVGDNQNFTFTADNGYEVHQLLIDGVHVPDSIAGGSYTFKNVTEDHSIAVIFKVIAVREQILFTWNADANSEKSFTLRATDGEEFVVDWGDGTTNTYTGNGYINVTITHSYNSTASYFVSVSASSTDGHFTYLYCPYNELTALDVSTNTALTALNCSGNLLIALDVSTNTALTALNCSGNLLIALDVSPNTALRNLYCNNNQLTTLDVSTNTALEDLQCNNNQLTALDINNTRLWRLDCANNQLTALDVSTTTALTYLYCYNNQLTALDLSQNSALTYLYCHNNQLTALDVSTNTALTYLYCYNNQLTALDVSNNTALTYLDCSYNQLTALDVSNNRALTYLYCYNNQLTALDVSTSTALSTLWCDNNQLTFSTLPLPPYSDYWYTPQAKINGGIAPGFVDLSSEYNIGGNITLYTWYELNGTTETEISSGYTDHGDGTFTFGSEFNDKTLRCKMTNATFPDFTASDPLVYEVTIGTHVQYTITATAGAGGSIDPEGEITVPEGDHQTFTFTADNGYEVDQLLIDEVNVPDSIAGGSYTFVGVTENHSIEVTFKSIPPTTYTISASAGENGSIDPEGEITVTEGDNQTFTFIADNGYEVDQLLIDEVNVPDSIAGGSYTFVDVMEDHTIEVTFKSIPPATYIITATAGENGTIDPEGEITVTEGDNQTFTFIADNGYEVDELLIDEVNVPDSIAGGSYTFVEVTEDHTIEVTFKPIPVTQYIISASAGENGTIDPEGEITVTEGDNQTFTFIANNGYEVDELLIDEVNVPDSIAGGSYTFVDVTEDHTIEVTFKSIPVTQYTITATAGENGSIDPEGEITVTEGDNQTFTFIANNGYEVDELLIDEVNVPDSIAGGSYTFENVTEDHTIEVTFKPIPVTQYTISASAGENGNIDPEGEITVTEGDNQTFTFIADNGYEVDQLLIDEVNVPDSIAGGSYTFVDVTEDHTIEVTFKSIPVTQYTITATAGENGSIDPEGEITVIEGDHQTFTFIADNGYEVYQLLVDEVNVPDSIAGGSYTFVDVMEDHSIEVTFKPIPPATYIITATAGENGSIDPEGEITVTEGDNQTFTFTADNGYEVDQLLVDEVNVPDSIAGGSYTFENVTEDHSIEITFKAINVPVTGVRVDPSALTLYGISSTAQLAATIMPANASNKNVSWSSDDESIVVVSPNGQITAVAIGSAVITVTTEDGEYTAICEVTVIASDGAVSGVELLDCPENGWLNVEETLSLQVIVIPEDAANKNVTWRSTNPNTAIVDASGTVTAKGIGVTYIIVKTMDGGFSDSCHIQVIQPVTGIRLTPSQMTLMLEEQKQLTARVLPENASISDIIWSSENETIAMVNASGKVTGLSPGTTNIIATTVDGGFEAMCQVTVVNAYAPATGITVTPKTLAINKGETAILTAEVKPANASQMVTWSSNNPAVATVAADGTVTALAAGKATITAKTDNNYKATCAVTVIIPIDSIVVTPDEWALPLKGAKALKATVYPADASNKTITWSSSNTTIATVSSTGTVTAKNINGVVEIYATNTASGKKGICVITVGTGIPAAPIMDISEENTTNHIVLYPNPTTGKVTIKSTSLVGRPGGAIKVFDITGRLVLEMNHVDDNEVILDLSGYAVGVYFINVDGKTMKVVKK